LNLCRTCDQDFTSVRLFDAHRVGAYGPGDYKGDLEDWSPEQGRRCLSIEEMEERGWAQNERDRWFDPAEVVRGLSALHRSSKTPSEAVA